MADGAYGNARVDSLIGRNIGHFRVDSVVGYGGMGAVYRAFDLSLERPVALKTVLLDNPQTRALFMREARAQAKLRHANVVPVHFIGDHEGLTYLVMELVEGESLATKVERDGAVPEARALEIVDGVAAALESAHAQGLIHRDVKPSNVLVEPSGRVLLADFGLAKVVGAGAADDAAGLPPAQGNALVSQTSTKGAIGTPAYIAPEVTSGTGKVDHRADIYSLGVTLYELVTGQRPFSGPTNTRVAAAHERAPVIPPRLIKPSVSKACETMILRMLAKAPDERFPTYAELRAALARVRQRHVPAAFVSRFVAFGIDVVPCLVVFFALQAALGIGKNEWAQSLVWLASAFVFALFESRRGRTWGKGLMGIHLIDELGQRPRFSAALVRSLVKLWGPILASALTFAVRAAIHSSSLVTVRLELGFLIMMVWVVWILEIAVLALVGPRTTLHDRAARTRVVVDLEAS
ncbi:MAG: protein kinase [Labilithrix sp.]